jgi:hypothetical protein
MLPTPNVELPSAGRTGAGKPREEPRSGQRGLCRSPAPDGDGPVLRGSAVAYAAPHPQPLPGPWLPGMSGGSGGRLRPSARRQGYRSRAATAAAGRRTWWAPRSWGSCSGRMPRRCRGRGRRPGAGADEGLDRERVGRLGQEVVEPGLAGGRLRAQPAEGGDRAGSAWTGSRRPSAGTTSATPATSPKKVTENGLAAKDCATFGRPFDRRS